MLNPVREGKRIEAIRYRRRLKILENFLSPLKHIHFKESTIIFVSGKFI